MRNEKKQKKNRIDAVDCEIIVSWLKRETAQKYFCDVLILNPTVNEQTKCVSHKKK